MEKAISEKREREIKRGGERRQYRSKKVGLKRGQKEHSEDMGKAE